MKLYNTLTRSVGPFTPLESNKVRIYSCGPTVYDHAHIGNLSAYIFADTLNRILRANDYDVHHAMNYTDVDDKTIRRSQEKYPDTDPRTALQTLTDEYISLFLHDMRAIGNDVEALEFLRATETIEGMKALIQELYESGFAYLADDGVYFSIEAYQKSGKTYGQLLQLTASNTSNARIQNDEYDKESVHDFALWKKQKPGEPGWEFALNGSDLTGRPGWHIECSVMSRQALGQPFDIHTGGIDLIFPHHENEIAQSTARETNPIMAQVFMHNNHILVEGKKMSKSLGNFYTLADVTTASKGYDPLAFRLMILQTHYRSQANFTWEKLGSAEIDLAALRKLGQLQHQKQAVIRKEPKGGVSQSDISQLSKQFMDALNDDINTYQALQELSGLYAGIGNQQLQDEAAFTAFIGLLELADQTLGLRLLKQPDITDEQKALIRQENEAWLTAQNTLNTAEKDFSAADKLKDELQKNSILLSNYKEREPIWHRL